MGSLEKGSTFKDGNKVVTVVGRFRDGTVLASTFSNDQMLPLKAAMSRVSNVLGREDRLNKEISNHGNYFGVIQDLTQSERPNVPVEQQRVLQGGLFNVATHLDVKDGLGETPEDVFVGGILTTKEGIKYRVQCPFARIATAWIKLENKVRRTESGN